MEWEESTEPGEQEGKGVALKSCTQFFHWLKTAEPEDEEEDQKVKNFNTSDTLDIFSFSQVSFTIGEESNEDGTVIKSNETVDEVGDKAEGV